MSKEPSKEVAKPASTAVVSWEQQLTALTVATQEAEKPSGNWISFKGGVVSVNGEAAKNNKLHAVIVHNLFENQLYRNKFNPSKPESPMCFAFAEREEELKPHPDSEEPQAESCASCPKNQWGSNPEGGKGKACQNVRRLAMIPSDDLDKIDKANVYLAKIPVMSKENWSVYASQLSNVFKMPPLAFITEVSARPDTRSMFQVEFAMIDKIKEPEKLQALLAKREAATPLIFSPYPKNQPTTAAPENKKF